MIDLRSDTVTKPSDGMREAMARAEVGDDVFGEDPTVNRIEEYAAELMGKEAALFVASGTMANLLAFLSQTRPGDSAILSELAHPYHYENANLAMIGGLLLKPVPDPLGKMSADQVRDAIVLKDDPHFSHTTIAALENTTNRGGGACYTFEETEAIGRVCRDHGLKLHCDGARIFNAAAATNIEPKYYARCCDTLSFCLSKGLGAPAGSLLTGTKATIHQARRFRKMLGGGMRQAGILAAAGLYALEHHVDDLEADHRRARKFRRALEEAGVRFPLPTPTNILFIEAENPAATAARLKEKGVLVLAHSATRLRAVFHRDISDADTDAAIEAFKAAM